MPVQVWLGNHWGHVRQDLTPVPPNVLDALTDALKFHPDGYKYSPAYPKYWDGYRYLFNRANGAFRAGLYDRVAKVLDTHGGHQKVPMVEGDHQRVNIALREGAIRSFDFQRRIPEIVWKHTRGIISSQTGSGKSIMMGLGIFSLQRRSLVLLNDLTLLGQIKRSLENTLDTPIGMIGDGEFDLQEVTVATIQSMCSILGVTKTKPKKGKKPRKVSPNRPALTEWLDGLGVVFHDEVHLADSASCNAVYLHFPNVQKVFGMSGTPYRWSEKQQAWGNIELEGVFGTMIYDTSDVDFVSLGLKVPTLIHQVEVPMQYTYNVRIPSERSPAYKLCVKQEIVESELWLDAIVQEANKYIRDDMSVFIYCAPNHGLEYGEKVAACIENAVLVNGSTSREERDDIFGRLQKKELLCVVSDIGGVGLDLPSLDVMIMASDVSDIRQIRGRVERAYPGKKYGIFVDLFKDGTFLSKHHNLRLNQYLDAGNTLI